MKKGLSFVLILALILSVCPLWGVSVFAQTLNNTVEISSTEDWKLYDFNNASGIGYKRYIKSMEYTDGALKLGNQAGSGSVWFAKDESFSDAISHPNSGAQLNPEAYGNLLRLDAGATYTVSYDYKFLKGSNRLGVQLMFAPDITGTVNSAVPSDWNYIKYVEKNLEDVTLPEGQTELLEDTAWHNASYTFTVGADGINLGIRPVAYSTGQVCFALVDNVSVKKCSKVSLSYSVSDGNAVIEECDKSAFGNLVIPEVLDGYTVTEIKNSAFLGCDKLVEIALPDTLTAIGDRAFADTALYNNPENWENGVLYCGKHLIKALTTLSGELSVKNGTVTVADSAFADCKSITSVQIPQSVKNIGRNAFLGCVNISTVSTDSLEDWCQIEFGANANPLIYADELLIGGSAVEGELVIPTGVAKIGNGAFSGFLGIDEVVIPSSVTEIGDFAFSDCVSLNKISLADGVEIIGNGAFNNCAAVTEIIIPDSVKVIEDYAFHGCSGVTDVTVGNGVETIGEFAFYGCDGIETVNISNLENWAKIDFENYDSNPLWYADGLYLNGQKLAGDVVLDDSITEIGNGAFFGMSGITSVYIPDSVTVIGDHAFYGCTALASVTGGKNVTEIGRHAFFGCSALKNFAVSGKITYIGDNAFQNCISLESFTLPSSVEDLGTGVFAGCISLKTLSVASGNAKYLGTNNCIIETATKTLVAGCKSSVIPSNGSVTSIGHSAFLGHIGLKSISVPNGVTKIDEAAFADCSALSSITLPDSVTVIGDHAFNGCEALVTADLGNGVTVIGDGAFKDCAALKTATVGGKLEIIGENAFSGCSVLGAFSIPEGAKTIGNGAFYGCSALKSITVPDSVVNFGCEVFSGCSALTTAFIGNGVTVLGDRTFYGCSKLNTVTLGNGLTAIGNEAFSGCSVLGGITIPDGVKSIGEKAFVKCSRLVEINIPDSVTLVGAAAFNNCASLVKATLGNGLTAISNNLFSTCPNLSEVNLSEGIITIGDSAFGNCKKLTHIDLPDTLKTIENGAFYNCQSLEELDLPDGLTVINQYAFFGCALIESLVIPEAVISIPAHTFDGCVSLTEAVIPYSVVTIGEGAFNGCNQIYAVYYGGLESEWTKKVKISSGNDAVINAQKVYRAEAPVVLGTVTADTVTLRTVEGYEYSMDGITWQASGVFSGLSAYTEYKFYARKAATDTLKAGYVSAATKVMTKPKIDLNGDGTLTEADAIYLLYHVVFGNKLYPVSVDADINADGILDSDDAIYVLYNVVYGEQEYPLYPDNSFDASGDNGEDKDQGFTDWVPIF